MLDYPNCYHLDRFVKCLLSHVHFPFSWCLFSSLDPSVIGKSFFSYNNNRVLFVIKLNISLKKESEEKLKKFKDDLEDQFDQLGDLEDSRTQEADNAEIVIVVEITGRLSIHAEPECSSNPKIMLYVFNVNFIIITILSIYIINQFRSGSTIIGF